MGHAEHPEAALLTRARAAGLALRVENGRLAVSGSKPSDDLLAELRAYRDGLIRALQVEAGEVATPPVQQSPQPQPADALEESRKAALQRPVSWADPSARPTQCCFCSCCVSGVLQPPCVDCGPCADGWHGRRACDDRARRFGKERS